MTEQKMSSVRHTCHKELGLHWPDESNSFHTMAVWTKHRYNQFLIQNAATGNRYSDTQELLLMTAWIIVKLLIKEPGTNTHLYLCGTVTFTFTLTVTFNFTVSLNFLLVLSLHLYFYFCHITLLSSCYCGMSAICFQHVQNLLSIFPSINFTLLYFCFLFYFILFYFYFILFSSCYPGMLAICFQHV